MSSLNDPLHSSQFSQKDLDIRPKIPDFPDDWSERDIIEFEEFLQDYPEDHLFEMHNVSRDVLRKIFCVLRSHNIHTTHEATKNLSVFPNSNCVFVSKEFVRDPGARKIYGRMMVSVVLDLSVMIERHGDILVFVVIGKSYEPRKGYIDANLIARELVFFREPRVLTAPATLKMIQSFIKFLCAHAVRHYATTAIRRIENQEETKDNAHLILSHKEEEEELHRLLAERRNIQEGFIDDSTQLYGARQLIITLEDSVAKNKENIVTMANERDSAKLDAEIYKAANLKYMADASTKRQEYHAERMGLYERITELTDALGTACSERDDAILTRDETREENRLLKVNLTIMKRDIDKAIATNERLRARLERNAPGAG